MALLGSLSACSEPVPSARWVALQRGRNLRPVYDALVRNRVAFVQEGDLDFPSESETFVDSIVITPTDAEGGTGLDDFVLGRYEVQSVEAKNDHRRD